MVQVGKSLIYYEQSVQASSGLLGTADVNMLVTSQSNIDNYFLMERFGTGSGNNGSGETHYHKVHKRFDELSNYNLSDKKNDDSERDDTKHYQFCRYKLIATFGYKDTESAIAAIGEKNITEINQGTDLNFVPKIIGTEFVFGRVYPDIGNVVKACEILMGVNKPNVLADEIEAWLIQDGVYESHVRQGLINLMELAEFVFTIRNKSDKAKIVADNKKAINSLVEQIIRSRIAIHNKIYQDTVSSESSKENDETYFNNLGDPYNNEAFKEYLEIRKSVRELRGNQSAELNSLTAPTPDLEYQKSRILPGVTSGTLYGNLFRNGLRPCQERWFFEFTLADRCRTEGCRNHAKGN